MNATEQGGAVQRYSTVAILLHWAIALFILFNIVSGFFLSHFPPGFIIFHISSGISVLALTVWRILWRYTHARPPYPADYKGWEVRLANLVHFLLYAGMLVLPLTGWALISANPPAGSPSAIAAAAERKLHGEPPRATGGPPIWFLFTLPLVKPINEMGRTTEGVPGQRALHDRLDTSHMLGGWAMLLLFLLHLGGALKHQFIDRHREFARMGIGRSDLPPVRPE